MDVYHLVITIVMVLQQKLKKCQIPKIKGIFNVIDAKQINLKIINVLFVIKNKASKRNCIIQMNLYIHYVHYFQNK